MRRTAVVSFIALCSLAQPCITLSGKGANPVAVASETAIIVWDPATKTEHFIRTASFTGDGKPMGFFVPTPTPPKLKAIDAYSGQTLGIAELERRIAPKTVIQKRSVYRLSEGWDIFPPAKSAAKSATQQLATAGLMYMADVDVLSQGQVGEYQTAVLRATDATALLRWLKWNGFESDARLEGWLAPYIAKGWAITAFRFEPLAPSFTSEPVCLSFKTDRPFYPYREPEAKGAPASRSLRVFLIAPERMKGALEGGPWPTPVEHSGLLGNRAASNVADAYELPDAVLARTRLTSFLDRRPVRPDSELYFDRDPDQNEVAVPPIVKVVDDPVYIPKGGVAIGAGIVVLALSSRRRTVAA